MTHSPDLKNQKMSAKQVRSYSKCTIASCTITGKLRPLWNCDAVFVSTAARTMQSFQRPITVSIRASISVPRHGLTKDLQLCFVMKAAICWAHCRIAKAWLNGRLTCTIFWHFPQPPSRRSFVSVKRIFRLDFSIAYSEIKGLYGSTSMITYSTVRFDNLLNVRQRLAMPKLQALC